MKKFSVRGTHTLTVLGGVREKHPTDAERERPRTVLRLGGNITACADCLEPCVAPFVELHVLYGEPPQRIYDNPYRYLCCLDCARAYAGWLAREDGENVNGFECVGISVEDAP